MVRELSQYQIRYLISFFRMCDAPKPHTLEVLHIGRIDEEGDLIIEWKQHGKITTTKVTFEQQKYE
jgi:hypothetical protein